MVFFLPCGKSVIICRRNHIVTIHRMRDPPRDCLCHLIGDRKVHIGNPQRQQVIPSKGSCHAVIFCAKSIFSLNRLIKIHSHTFFLLYIVSYHHSSIPRPSAFARIYASFARLISKTGSPKASNSTFSSLVPLGTDSRPDSTAPNVPVSRCSGNCPER